MKKYALLIYFLIGFCVIAQDVAERPAFIHPVVDSTNTLSRREFNALYEKLKNYSDTTSTEIFVMIAKSSYGDDINLYATELGHKWGIGQSGKDNGIVIFVAKDDREVAIQSGYGVEHLLTDALAKRVIEYDILTEFKEGNYYQGLDNATTSISQILAGEYSRENSSGSGFPFWLILLLIIIFFYYIIK